MPERATDFRCYEGFHYFTFIGVVLVLSGIIATIIYYCRMLRCCMRCCCECCKHKVDDDEKSIAKVHVEMVDKNDVDDFD